MTDGGTIVFCDLIHFVLEHAQLRPRIRLGIVSALRASFLTFYLIPDLTVGAILCRRFAAYGRIREEARLLEETGLLKRKSLYFVYSTFDVFKR